MNLKKKSLSRFLKILADPDLIARYSCLIFLRRPLWKRRFDSPLQNNLNRKYKIYTRNNILRKIANRNIIELWQIYLTKLIITNLTGDRILWQRNIIIYSQHNYIIIYNEIFYEYPTTNFITIIFKFYRFWRLF